MQDREGDFIRANTIAGALKLRDKVVSQILRELTENGLLVEKRNDTQRKIYCYKPKEVLKNTINAPKFVKPFTPYQYPIGMIQALERCKQDRGGEYHAISMGGVGL